MGPQARHLSGHRYSLVSEITDNMMAVTKERMLSGSGSAGSTGSPGRLHHENISRDSGIGCLKEGGHNTSGETENDIPKFITDGNDKTSYMRGKFLGKGGFARVHELIDLKSNAVSAAKIIHKSRISKPHHKEKISREIELHRSLRHKNVVQFFKHFEDGDNIYIMLENCSRKSLVHVLKSRGTVTEPETRYYMSALCHGVEYIHSQNIIHRDLKLGNLFLTHTMSVKIGDFGLATKLGLEKKGTICGTPNYISPEVLNKEGHGFPADVWALGCVMYALLVGQPPFETSTLKETYSRIADNVYTIPDTVSPSAAALIRVLLHPRPGHRPTVPSINQDSFFYSGYHPLSLSSSCCTEAPVFPSNAQMFSHAEISNLTSSVLSLSLPDQQQQQQQQHHQQQQQMQHHSNMDTCHVSNKKPKLKTRTSALYEAILNTLNVMPSRQDPSLTPCKEGPLFITKWIDYSNKYGFGFQLSDRSVGVLFNDHSRISYSADRRFVQFGEGNNLTTMSANNVPGYLHEKFTLLRYFAQYMDENLTEGGEGSKAGAGGIKTSCGVLGTRSSNPNIAIPQIKRWIRAPKAIIMHLTNGTIQVNYFKDHTKLIVGGDRQPMVTYINTERQSRSWSLSDLARKGASAQVRERMSYVASVLEEFAELDEQASS